MDNNTDQSNFSLPQPVAPQPPQPVQATGPLMNVPAPTTPASPASTAQDRDAIEPEWLRAVDAITKQYIEDPRKLSEELTKLKARYIKERYNKEIKSSEGKSA